MRTPDPFVGRDILDGRFQILQKIGTGAMGAVYKALEIDLGRHVAVKLLHAELARDKAYVSRFRREARALGLLAHPNTVRVFSYGELGDGILYIIMEHLTGKNLNQMVRREGPMPIERALPIMTALCGALDEAHQLGMVHRDIKPENIFLCEQPRDFPKILDFGIAKLDKRQMRPGSILLTQEGTVFGTPEFMSPEQAQGRTLTGQSDLYSLGVLLYEVLTGKLPFDAKTPMEYIQLHVTAAPIALDARVPGKEFPRELVDAMSRALAKRTEDRFASISDLATALALVPLPSPPPVAMVDAHTPAPPATPPGLFARITRWARGERSTTETIPSPASLTELGVQRLGTIRPTNADALDRLQMAARMAADADAEHGARAARSKRRASALETIQSIEKTLLARLDRAADRDGARDAWRRLLPDVPPKKMAFEQLRLHQFVSSGDRPSLAVLARWTARENKLGESLRAELREILGVPEGVEEELARAGAVRIVLAHQAEYELDEAEALRETGECVTRVESEHGAEIDVPPETLVLFAWVSACIMERRLRPRR